MFWEDDDPGLLDAGQPETRVKSEPVPEDQECRLPIIDPAFDAPYGLRQIEQINFQIEDPYGGFDDYVSDEYNPATEAREPARRQVKRVRSSHGGYGHRNGSNTSEERGPTRKQVKRKGSFYKRHYGHGAENVFPIAKDPRNSSLLNQRNNGFSLPVTLTLPKVLLTYAQWKPLREFLEQWPDNWPIRNVDEEELPNFTELSYDNIQQDRLRIRGSTQSGSSQDRVGHQQKWEQYSLGHPEARGCKNCVCLGNECELIKGSKYPCRSCYHLGEDCELILEPPEKGPCLHCGKKKMKCSFLENRQQLGGCDQCSRMGFRCISVPRHKHTRYNSRIDHHGRAGRHKKEKVSEKAPIRKFGNDFRGSGSNNFRESGGNDFSEMSCTECRQNDLPCSFAHTPNFEDCEACQESGCECIVDIPQTPPEVRFHTIS